MVLEIILPTIARRIFVALVPRTIALGIIGLLFVGLLSQGKAASSVTLAWNPGTPSGVAGYRVYYGTSSGVYPQMIDVGNTTTATVSNLAARQTYYFVVTDYNTVGLESAASNQVSFTATPNSPGTIAKGFNGDGYADLVWENSTTGQRVIWFLVNGAYSSYISLPTVSPDWHIAGVGDFLGNGQSDLVWENTVSGQHAIWILNNGVLQFGIDLPTVSGGWHIAGAADFNGDGQADLVWENTLDGERAIWLLKDGVLSSWFFLPTVSTQWSIVDH